MYSLATIDTANVTADELGMFFSPTPGAPELLLQCLPTPMKNALRLLSPGEWCEVRRLLVGARERIASMRGEAYLCSAVRASAYLSPLRDLMCFAISGSLDGYAYLESCLARRFFDAGPAGQSLRALAYSKTDEVEQVVDALIARDARRLVDPEDYRHLCDLVILRRQKALRLVWVDKMLGDLTAQGVE